MTRKTKELEATPDYNFFNIFYRNSSDRDRDELVKALLEEKAESEKESKEKPSEDKKLTDEQRAEIKKKTARMTLLAKIQKELGRLYDGAQFALAKDEKGNLIVEDGKHKLVILDKDGKETQIDRALLWELGFNNSESSIFPENKDSKIIIEDHHLDNRLVYDEIIVNDTEANWKKLKEEAEKAKKIIKQL